MVVPIRAHLDSVRRLLKGDVYIGRGSKQRALPKSRYCNNYKVTEYGRDAAIGAFRSKLLQDDGLYASLWTLSGTRLVCHCCANDRCHGDILLEEFRRSYPSAHDREGSHGPPPEANVLNCVARLREEPESDDGSSADEGVPSKFAGHRGIGIPMQVGIGYVQRDFCDGQSLASPGRWTQASRVYPSTDRWESISGVFQRFTEHFGAEELLVSLAVGNVESCPIPSADIVNLKNELIGVAAGCGFQLERRSPVSWRSRSRTRRLFSRCPCRAW